MRFFEPSDYAAKNEMDEITVGILAKHGLDMSVFTWPLDRAVEVLVERITDPREALVLYDSNFDIPTANDILIQFLHNVIIYLSPRETVDLALDCFADEMFKTTSLLLALKFPNTLDNRLSASHFLYECLHFNAPLQFIKFGLSSLPDGARGTYMYDLVGPEQKPILQILIEQNRADIMDFDHELMFCATYYSPSLLKMIDNHSVPSSPFFWIDKKTRFEVVDLFIKFHLDFSKKDSQHKSILLHAIEKDCDTVVLTLILRAYPQAVNEPDSRGIYPLFAAYERNNLFAMSLLVNYGATQAIGFIAKADDTQYPQDKFIVRSTIMHSAVRECDFTTLSLLLSRPDVYKQQIDADFKTPFDLAIQLDNIGAALSILTCCEKMSDEKAQRAVFEAQILFKGANISRSI